jgi:FemAB-related protein (PEP-CTERM system-associated)
MDTWDDYVLKHPDGTAYQLFAWRVAIEDAYAFKGLYLIAVGELGICGILPLIDFRIPFLGRTLISLPYCDVGGVLAENDDVEQALLDHAQELATQQRSECHIRAVRLLPKTSANQTDKVRMMLDLPSSAAQLQKNLSAKVRSQVKKPVRDGLTVKIGTSELVDEFYRVFAENMRALGSPVHSRRWIESIVSAYGDRARIVVVRTPDGIPAAAGVVLIHPSAMSVPWASSLRRYNRYNPNMLLYWTFLTLAIDAGCRYFDFGRSTPGEGTYRFKQQWGAQPELLYWYEPFVVNTEKIGRSRLASYSKTAPKRQIAASLWQKLPQASTDWLGPKVRKYISL